MISLSKSKGKSHCQHTLPISSLILSNILSSITLYCYFRHTVDEIVTSSFPHHFSFRAILLFSSNGVWFFFFSKYVMYMITTLKWVIMQCNLLSFPPLFSSLLSADLLRSSDAANSWGEKSFSKEVPRSHHFCYQWQASTDYNQIRWSFKSKSYISLDIIFISSTRCITSQLSRNVITVLIEIED